MSLPENRCPDASDGMQVLNSDKPDHNDGSTGKLLMPEAVDNDAQIRMLNSIREISSRIDRGASCADIADRVVDALRILLPEARVLVLETNAGASIATVLASAGFRLLGASNEIPIVAESVVSCAAADALKVHSAPWHEASASFPDGPESSVDADSTAFCKALPRPDGLAMVLTVIAGSVATGTAGGVLTAFSDLLISLCRSHDAAVQHTKNLRDIARAKREWERTVDALPELVCLVDQSSDVVRINRTAERWGLGEVSQLVGTNIHTLIHRDCSNPHCSLLDAVSLTMASRTANGYLQTAITDRKLGRTFIVHTRLINGLPTGSGQQLQPFGVIVVSDISALHNAQKELSTLNEDLEKRVRRRTAKLESTNRDLAEEMQRRRLAERDVHRSRDELARLSKQLIEAQEAERLRLSRELHDSLGQSLGAIKYSLERVQATSDAGDELSGIVARLSEAIRETRSLAIALRPPALDELGIVSALKSLCQNFGSTFLDTDFHIDIDLVNSDVPSHLATPIYRIVQEALNNVVKHAAARSVMVALHTDEDKLYLEILDDGVGFDEETMDKSDLSRFGNFGRIGMRERAANSGGRLIIESWPGEGTRVLGEWPVDSDEPAIEEET